MATVGDHKTLYCPLCCKRFTSPRVLPCFHTFCEKCLGADIEKQIQGGSKYSCPLCGKKTVPFDSSLSVDKWAKAFPLNTVICSVMQSMEDLDDNDDNCVPCKTVGDTKVAKFWCVDCQEKICNFCNESHKRIKLLKHHTTVSVDKMEQHIQSNINFVYECGRHLEKVKLFCVNHRKLCCAMCVATNHRQCNDVLSIDDIVHDQSERSTSNYSSIIRDIGILKTEMEKILSEKKNNRKEILQEKDKILHEMNISMNKIIKRLNELLNSFGEVTNQLCKDTECFIQENEKIIQRFLINIENFSEILNVMVMSETPREKFTTFENIRDQISSHYNQLKSHFQGDVEMHLHLIPKKVLEDLEETLDSLGTVEVSKKSSTTSHKALQYIDEIIKSLESHTKISTEICGAQVEKVQDLMTSSLTFSKAVKFGTSASIGGGAFLGNGHLMMADFCNNRLLELNDEYSIVKEYQVGYKPSDVAAGNKNNEIYIANSSYIYRYTLRTDLNIVSKIKSPSGTWGIAVNGDNIIVGTPDAVLILTQDGSKGRSIPKSEPWCYVAVLQTQRTIYHKDKNNIVCRTWDGNEMFRYEDQKLKEPRGICIDRYNNVYICGYASGNVYQISSDGLRSRVMLDKLQNILNPCTVIMHPQKNELVITSWNENTVLEVYRLG